MRAPRSVSPAEICILDPAVIGGRAEELGLPAAAVVRTITELAALAAP